MNETTAEFKNSVLKKAEKAASGKAPLSCTGSCPQCQRVDLQMLVVTPSVVTEEYSTALRVAKHAWTPLFDDEFARVNRKVTLPVARIARPGFLMVFFPAEAKWDVWQVMQYGLTRKIMHQVDATAYGKMHGTFAKPSVEEKVCSLKAANFKAHLISIAGAGGIEKAWIAFTDTLWTKTTLERYAENPTVPAGTDADGKPLNKPLRDIRGREINPKSILNGTLPKGGLRLDGPTLQQRIADFVASPNRNYHAAFAFAQKPLDEQRFGKAEDFSHEVRKIERASGPKYLNKSIIMMVPDPVGVTELHNRLRADVLARKQAWIAGNADVSGNNVDPHRPWKRQSTLQAGFIRDWVKKAERESQEESRIAVAVIANHTIDEATYVAIQKDKHTGGANSKTKPYSGLFDPAIVFQPLEGEPKRYLIVWPGKSGAAREKAVNEGAASKLRRYNRHLDWNAINEHNKAYQSQEKTWDNVLAQRDRDYVTWLTHPATAATLDNDFDKHEARQNANRSLQQLTSDVYDAAQILNTTARCYGGGGLAEPSMTNLLFEMAKDEYDKANRIGRALIAKFVPKKLMDEKGVQAHLYSALDSANKSAKEFNDAWKDWRGISASPATILALAASETTSRMQELSRNPALATKSALKFSVADAAKKDVIWIRASAFHKYLESKTALYYVTVAWDSHSFLKAALDKVIEETPAAKVLKTPAFKLGTAKSAKSYERSKLELKRFLAQYGQSKTVSIPLVFDQDFLRKLAAKFNEPMVDIVSHGLMGLPSGVTQIPKSMAEALIVEQSSLKNFRMGNFKLIGSFNVLALFLQTRAVLEAFDNVKKLGGLAQMDAIAGMISSATGAAGAFAELCAMMLAPGALTASGTPISAQLAAKVPVHLRIQYSAGLFTAAGAFFDSAVSFIRFRNSLNKGDTDAASFHLISSTSLAFGSINLAVGSYNAYHASVMGRAGSAAMMRVLGASISPMNFARCLTGIGLVFWLAGLAISYYALTLEDDTNEIHLRRTIFGTGHPELGKYATFDEEMQYFAALNVGSNATLEWKDRIFTKGDDEITVTITINYPAEPARTELKKDTTGDANIKAVSPSPMRHIVRIVLDGYDGIKGKKTYQFYSGALPPLTEGKGKSEKGVFKTTQTFPVPSGVEAARLTYMLFTDNAPQSIPVARGDLWIED